MLKISTVEQFCISLGLVVMEWKTKDHLISICFVGAYARIKQQTIDCIFYGYSSVKHSHRMLGEQ